MDSKISLVVFGLNHFVILSFYIPINNLFLGVYRNHLVHIYVDTSWVDDVLSIKIRSLLH